MTDKAVDKESSNVNDKDTAADGGESGASSSRLTTMSAKNCSDVKPSPSLSPASSSSGGSPTSSSSASHTHTPPASSNPPPASSNPPPASSNPPPASSDPSPASSNPPPTSSNPPPASSNSPPASVAANSRQRSSHSDSGQHASLSEHKVSDAKASAINSSLIVHRTRQCTRKNVANQHHTPSPSSSSSSSSGRHGSASTAKSSRINSRNVRHRDNDATGPSRVQDECRRTRTRSAGAVEHLEPSDLAQLVPVTELLVKPEPAPVLPTPTMPTGSSQPNQQHKPTANKPPAVEPTANKPPAVEPTASVMSQSAQNLVYNWQASKTTIRQRLSFMCDNSLMADIHFLVGKYPPQRIPAHKFVLSIGSAVFDAMFNGAMACEGDEVELPDVEPSAFLALLRFLYTDQVQIDAETVMTTLYTAKKYSVPALEEACVDFLKRNLSSDNAFMLLTQARLFDEPQLAGLCLEMIDKSTSEALNAEGFSDIDMSTLSVVLERDTLGIRESKLFAALQRWAQAECVRQDLEATAGNQRQVLGRALYQIRFPLMTVEEFAMGPAQSGLLRDRELVELFLHFTVNPKPRVAFEDTPRCCLTGKEQVVSRFCHVENRWGYSGTSDRIRFTVNRRIFVVGFGLYGSIHGPAEYTVNMQVIQTDSGNICGQNDTTFQSDGSMATFRVMFKEPIEIQPNSSYTACATLKGPDSYYGTKGLRKVTHESVSSGKVTFQFTYAAGNNNGSSVEDGQLPEIVFYT